MTGQHDLLPAIGHPAKTTVRVDSVLLSWWSCPACSRGVSPLCPATRSSIRLRKVYFFLLCHYYLWMLTAFSKPLREARPNADLALAFAFCWAFLLWAPLKDLENPWLSFLERTEPAQRPVSKTVQRSMYVEAAKRSPRRKLRVTWAGLSQSSWLQFLEGWW